MKTETYEMQMQCNNCGHEWIENIPRGTSCDGLLCPNCGCWRGSKRVGIAPRFDLDPGFFGDPNIIQRFKATL